MILVTGAAGFVGRHLLRRLLAKGETVRGMVLPGDRPTMEHDRLSWAEGDVRDPGALDSAVAGVRQIVHLAAVVASPDEELNSAVNAIGTENLLAAAGAAGVERFIFMSAAAVKFKNKNAYGRSKRQAEAAVVAAGLDYAIIRTPLIIGSGGEEWDRFVDYVGKFPVVVPVFGDGKAIKRPVYIGDVAGALEALLAREILGCRVYEVACRETVTLNQLIDETCRARGMRKVKVHIPLRLSLFLARMAEIILGARSPITRDIVLGLNENVEFDVEGALGMLNLNPLSVSEAISRSPRSGIIKQQ